MLTFLELYQTLLGFVLFKLYTDAGLVYPPPLDTQKDEGGAGVDAFRLQESQNALEHAPPARSVTAEGKRVSSKEVRQTIKSIAAGATEDADVDVPNVELSTPEDDEDFVPQPSKTPQDVATLPTLQALSTLTQSTSTKLFAPYTFWLSRETSRPIFEFIVRSFGGRIGWPATLGSGSPFDESDESITHVIIDRPLVVRENETREERERRQRRKYVQPQWIVDCVNAGKILLEDLYAQGKTLPPHLSPFEDREGAYDPTVGLAGEEDAAMDEEDEDSDVENARDHEKAEEAEKPERAALKAAAGASDATALRAAELEAEAAGVDFGTFEQTAKKARKKVQTNEVSAEDEAEGEMNKMLMSNKQRKLFERMKHGEKKRAAEVCH